MKSWNNLPEEILSIIFNTEIILRLSIPCNVKCRVLNDQDLLQCEFVCRNWKLPAQRIIYTRLKVDEYNCQKLIDGITSSQQSPGPLVKSLNLDGLSNAIIHDYLHIFSEIFPSVKKIQFPELGHDIYSRLIQLRSGSKWQSINDFGIPEKGAELEMYATCITTYHSTLTTLLLCDSKLLLDNTGSIGDHKEEYARLVNDLDQFPQLQALTLKRRSNDGIDSFDSVFQKCPALTGIDICLCPDIDTELPNYIEPIDLSLIAPKTKIKTLTGALLIINDNSLLYIMHKFPYLKELSFIQGRDEEEELNGEEFKICMLYVPSRITSTVLSKFLLYSTAIPSCIFYIPVKPSVITDAFHDYSSNLPGNALFSLHIEYTTGTVNALSIMDADEQSATLLMEHGIEGDNTKRLGIKYYSADHLIRHLNIIETFGKFVNNLTFSIDKKKLSCILEDAQENAYNMATGYFLDHIFQHCPNLTQLDIEKSTLVHCNPNNISQSKSITQLTLYNVVIYKDILHELSARLPSLKTVHLSLCKFQDIQYRYFYIDLGYSSLDTLFIQMDSRSTPLICVKLSLATKDKYYRLEIDADIRNYEISASSKDAYEMAKKEQMIRFNIRCRSIQEIKLTFSYVLIQINPRIQHKYNLHGKITVV